MEQNNTKANIENNIAEAEGGEIFEETSKKEKVDCSHRVIEKRRRDRINNSLLQLSKLIPIENFNKKNNGKLEKAEILEVTVNYLTQQKFKKEQEESSTQTPNETIQGTHEASKNQQQIDLNVFLKGFKQCISDATKFFQDIEELDVSEGRCYRLIQHLKRQTSRYETKERDLSNFGREERGVWDTEEARTGSDSRIVPDSTPIKRNNDGNLEEITTTCKKSRPSNESISKPEQTSGTEQECLAGSTLATSRNSETSRNADPSLNYMPFVFPNMPLFTTLPFAGANNMARFQAPSSQYPSYPYQQQPQYIPFAFPQFPVMGMNFMPGFGVVNGEQNQNGAMPATAPNALPMHSGVPNQANLNLMPPGISNGFFPSMYSNGLHANIVSMRPRDSGYESSEKSSSSKASGSGTSPQSFSDDSCQSYTA